MKRLIINAFTIVLLMVISFGARAQSNDALKATVAKMNQEMIELAKAGNYEAMGKFYNEDVIYLPNNKVAVKGYQQLLTSNMQKKQSGYNILEGHKNTTEIFVSGDLLVDVGTFTMSTTIPGYSAAMKDYGKYINVWKKDKEGNWKIVAETWNTDKNNMIGPSQVQGRPEGAPAPVKQSQTDTATIAVPAQGSTNSVIEAQPAKTGTQQPVVDTKDGKK